MADMIQIKNITSQVFTGTGEGSICTLDITPNKIKTVTIDGIETKSYTFNENVVTVDAVADSIIEVTYDYWMAVPTIKGDAGESAHDAALKGGWIGTEEEFYSAVANIANKQENITATGMLKGNGFGEVVKAIAGADYVIPSGNVATANALANSRTIQTNLASTNTATFNGTEDVKPGVTGILPVANGGTGSNSIDNAPTTGSTRLVTSGGVFNALAGKADTNHTQSASTISGGTLGGSVSANANGTSNLATPQIRNIYAGTADLVAGVSSLPTGSIYICYEA